MDQVRQQRIGERVRAGARVLRTRAREANWRRIGLWGGGGIALFLLVLATFPFGLLRGAVETQLSRRLGAAVTIGALEREQAFSFFPRLRFRDVRIPQPEWVGDRAGGAMFEIDEGHIQIRTLGLLTGSLDVRGVSIGRGRANLYRDAEGRESWTDGSEGSGSGPTLSTLAIDDLTLSYIDDRRRRRFRARIRVDGSGVRLAGSGSIDGNPVNLSGRAAPVEASGAWPFRLDIRGDAVGATLAGTADRAFDLSHFTAVFEGYGEDLKLLDKLIEAGLPGTQDVRLRTELRRDGDRFRLTGLRGTVGRSAFTGEATLERGERARLDGRIDASRLDFDDLASDEGLRRAAALTARIGPRLVPPTDIDLSNIKLDGRLAIRVRRLLFPTPQPFRTLTGTAVLDAGRLSIDDLRVGLDRGAVTGSIVIDQRQGDPTLRLRLAMDNARLVSFFPNAGVDGRLRARVTLAGDGGTVREAIGRSTGSVAFTARDGRLPARTASLLGQDVGRGVTTDESAQATLRCLIVRLDVEGGTARPAPIVIDTSRAVTRAGGSINLANERLSLTLSGAPKSRSVLRLRGDIGVSGTIRSPDIQVPESARSVGGVLRMVGDAITGNQGELASSIDCAAAERRALR